jgi:recombinational DNA repair ATPase RecF
MELKRLTLTQFRAFEQAEFVFTPGMNLIAGINGAGKSTVLDVLRVLLSQTLPEFTASKSKPDFFTADDIAVGRDYLTAELQFEALGMDFSYLAHKQGEEYGNKPSQPKSVPEPAHHVGRRQRIALRRAPKKGYRLPEYYELYTDEDIPRQSKANSEQPFAVYFSTRRSLLSRTSSSKAQRSVGGQAVAFAEALLVHRELSAREFAEWWLVREALASEGDKKAKLILHELRSAVLAFLDTFSDLRAMHGDDGATLKLTKGNIELDARQLSDGERGILSLVLDLARRLAQANPNLDEPLHNGRAVVLIDELDLHLHPRWQRTIVQKLIETFPGCQFIATTHSPQIIGEVPPEQIILLEQGKQPYRPDQSLGMDSNWILQILMDTPDRNEETTRELERISDLIEDGEYEEAAAAIQQLREQIPSDPELARLQTRLDRLQILGE